MRGWILLGLVAVVLLVPNTMATDSPGDDFEDDSRTCVSYMHGILSANPATCVRAVTSTAQWVIDEVPDSTSS